MNTRRRPRVQHPDTEKSHDIEAARYRKAAKVARLLIDEYGEDIDPSNVTCRCAADILIAKRELYAGPFSDRACELVRAILTTRRLVEIEEDAL